MNEFMAETPRGITAGPFGTFSSQFGSAGNNNRKGSTATFPLTPVEKGFIKDGVMVSYLSHRTRTRGKTGIAETKQYRKDT